MRLALVGYLPRERTALGMLAFDPRALSPDKEILGEVLECYRDLTRLLKVVADVLLGVGFCPAPGGIFCLSKNPLTVIVIEVKAKIFVSGPFIDSRLSYHTTNIAVNLLFANKRYAIEKAPPQELKVNISLY